MVANRLCTYNTVISVLIIEAALSLMRSMRDAARSRIDQGFQSLQVDDVTQFDSIQSGKPSSIAAASPLHAILCHIVCLVLLHASTYSMSCHLTFGLSHVRTGCFSR